MNADKPLVLREGSDLQTKIYNRIAVLDRVKYLSGGVNLKEKPDEYLAAFDLAMWENWYKDAPPNTPVNDLWCYRAAEVIKTMEGNPIILDKKRYAEALNDFEVKKEQYVDECIEGGGEDAGEAGEQSEGGVRQGDTEGSDQVSGGEGERADVID